MGRPCTVCSSPKHERMDVELVAGQPAPAIARRYKIGVDALRRHKSAHLSPALVRIETEVLRDGSARNAA